MALGAGLLAACQTPAASPSAAAATAVVDSLYQARKPFQANGAPTTTDLDIMRRWLSVELATLLHQADSVRSAEAAANPDEKPAFADGDLFTSLFEGPTGFEVMPAESISVGKFRVPVHFTFRDSTANTLWTDTVLVITEGGKPVVHDVQYGGSWDFANHGALLPTLHAALAGAHP